MNLTTLASGKRTTVCGDGNILVSAGESSDTVFLLVHGAVELVLEDAPYKGLVVGICAAPDLVGVESMLSRRPHALTVRALGPLSYVRLDREAIGDFLSHDQRAAQICAQIAAAREEKVLATMQTLLGPADDRLAALLNDYARYCGRAEGQGHRLLIRRTQQELSLATGLTLRHVNRLLQRWRRAGRILRDGNDVIIPEGFFLGMQNAA